MPPNLRAWPAPMAYRYFFTFSSASARFPDNGGNYGALSRRSRISFGDASHVLNSYKTPPCAPESNRETEALTFYPSEPYSVSVFELTPEERSQSELQRRVRATTSTQRNSPRGEHYSGSDGGTKSGRSVGQRWNEYGYRLTLESSFAFGTAFKRRGAT